MKAKGTIWDYWAIHYEGLWVQKSSLGPTRIEIMGQLKKKILSKDKHYRVLDMGCGTGQLLRGLQVEMKEYNLSLMGVDLSEEMIKVAKAQSQGITYLVADANHFEIEEGFDFIICSHSFPYYIDKQGVIRRFHGLLKEEGSLLLAQASINGLYDAMVMFLVRFTTTRASYLSATAIRGLMMGLFREVKSIKIKTRNYMPSIYLFVAEKRRQT